MTLKKVLIITGVWTVLMFGVAIGLITYVHKNPIPGVRSADRAAKLGTGLGTFTSFGYAVIWLPYAAKIGKEKRAQREAQKRAAQKKPKRSR